MPHARLRALGTLAEILVLAADEYSENRRKAFRLSRQGSGVGRTLRPGRETPLWNALVEELRPHLKKYGTQAELGRLLGLDRQAVNAFVRGGTRMPDAERTLQLLTWLIATRQGTPPS